MRSVYLLALLLLLLAGCSNHPLVDDVTGYSTYDIVQKLRCEAQSAVFKELEGRHLDVYRGRILDLRAELKAYAEWRAANNTVLEKIDEEIEKNDAADKANQKLRKELKTQAEVLGREVRFLTSRMNKSLKEGTLTEQEKTSLNLRLGKLYERAHIMTAKIEEAAVQGAAILKTIKDTETSHDIKLRKLNMNQKSYLVRKKHNDDIAEVLKTAIPSSERLSELFPGGKNAELRELFAISRTTIWMKLDFKITEKNNAIADGSLTWPLTLGSVSLGYKAGKERAREAQRVVQITATFEELSDKRTLDCDDPRRHPVDKRARSYPIVGNVGIDELIGQYFKVLRGTISLATKEDTFTDQLGFTTKISGKINPTIEIKPVNPSLVKGGLDLNAERTDLHQVAVQIRPYSPPSPSSDPKLQITKIPNVTVTITEGMDGDGSSINVR